MNTAEKVKKPKVCYICGHPRAKHIARVGCVHDYGIQATIVGKSVCDCTSYTAEPKGR